MLFNNWWLIVCFSVPAINGCYSFFLIHMDKFKCKGSWRTQLCVIWLHMVNDKVMMNAAIWITIQQMFFLNAAGKLISTLNLFFVITKTCNQICLFHSLLLIHILDQKYLDGKPVIDRNVISIPKAPAQLITVPPNLLDAVQCEKKNIYSVCVCVCTCAHLCVRLPRRSHVFYSCWV